MGIRLLLVSVMVVAAGCGGLGEREQRLHEKCVLAAKAEDWATARDSSSALIEAEPGHMPSYILRGHALFELGDYVAALQDFQRVEQAGGWTGEDAFMALYYQGRCWIELGCHGQDTRSTPPERDPGAEREPFLKANALLEEAANIASDEDRYEANAWRSYALLCLDNRALAADCLKACEAIHPERWEHKFFAILAREAVAGVTTEGVQEQLEIVAPGPRREFTPVYEHLAAVSDSVSPELARKIYDAVSAFAAAVPKHPGPIGNYLLEYRKKVDSDRRLARKSSTNKKAKELIAREQFKEAVDFLEDYLRQEGSDQEVEEVLRDTEERWSVFLEVRTETLIASNGKEDLATALLNYRLAHRLTKKVDRLVILQQKINALELAVTRQDSSQKIQQTHDLLKAGRYADVLKTLAAVPPEGLSEHDRDLYNYLRGSSYFQLGDWESAVRCFHAVRRASFENMDTLYGLALVRSGQQATGVMRLENLSPKARTEEVNRTLGHYYVEHDDFAKAVECLSVLKTPSQPDLEALLRARRECGVISYKRGDYSKAIEEFQAARQILEVQLRRKATDIYLYLGNAYFLSKDCERAKKIYQDLIEADLTQAEKVGWRDLFLNLGRIHLQEKHPDLSYKALSDFIRLGGELPLDMADAYGRLVATYADFMPLDRIEYWSYSGRGLDSSYSLRIKAETGGEYRVEKKEGTTQYEETWSRRGIFLTKQAGERIEKLPINLNPSQETPPSISYTSQGQECKSELVGFQEAVELRGGRQFTDCLKIRIRRRGEGSKGGITEEIVYLAPGVGEVKREIYRNGTKATEVLLSDYALRKVVMAGK